jgi:ubiquitin-conjugating enzyme E2 O
MSSQHILQPPANMLGFFVNRPSSSDTVIAVLHTVLAIAWLAVNQSVCSPIPIDWLGISPSFSLQLDPLEAQSRRRPNKFWHGPDIAKLTLVPSRSEQLRVGEKVELSIAAGLPSTVHGQEGGRPEGRITVQTFTVKETRTTVNVLWQDGTRETIKAVDLIPYLNPDESDCW